MHRAGDGKIGKVQGDGSIRRQNATRPRMTDAHETPGGWK